MADGDRMARVSGDEEKAGGGENRVTGLFCAVEQAAKRIAVANRAQSPHAA